MVQKCAFFFEHCQLGLLLGVADDQKNALDLFFDQRIIAQNFAEGRQHIHKTVSKTRLDTFSHHKCL